MPFRSADAGHGEQRGTAQLTPRRFRSQACRPRPSATSNYGAVGSKVRFQSRAGAWPPGPWTGQRGSSEGKAPQGGGRGRGGGTWKGLELGLGEARAADRTMGLPPLTALHVPRGAGAPPAAVPRQGGDKEAPGWSHKFGRATTSSS